MPALNPKLRFGRISSSVRDIAKSAILASPLRRWMLYKYAYNFSPAQLGFLCECLDRTRHIDLPIVEIGCFQGRTTAFLNAHMTASGIEKPYICIDTFSGFTGEDVGFEVTRRGKDLQLFDGFQSNSKRWFDQTMTLNGITRVRSIQADVNTFDFSQIPGASVCLIDVDLYRPMKRALEEMYPLVPSGGIIIADDCSQKSEKQIFDGADQAYREFTTSNGLPPNIVCDKLGLICKP